MAIANTINTLLRGEKVRQITPRDDYVYFCDHLNSRLFVVVIVTYWQQTLAISTVSLYTTKNVVSEVHFFYQ